MVTKLLVDCRNGIPRDTKVTFGGVEVNSLTEISVDVSIDNITEATVHCDFSAISPEGYIQCRYQGRRLMVHFEADPGKCSVIDIETGFALIGIAGFKVRLTLDGPELSIRWNRGLLKAPAGTITPESLGIVRNWPEDEEFDISESVWLGFNGKLIKCTVISRTTAYSSGKPVVTYNLKTENGTVYSEIKPSRITKEKDYAGN